MFLICNGPVSECHACQPAAARIVLCWHHGARHRNLNLYILLLDMAHPWPLHKLVQFATEPAATALSPAAVMHGASYDVCHAVGLPGVPEG